jgi:hypothetical protein
MPAAGEVETRTGGAWQRDNFWLVAEFGLCVLWFFSLPLKPGEIFIAVGFDHGPGAVMYRERDTGIPDRRASC